VRLHRHATFTLLCDADPVAKPATHRIRPMSFDLQLVGNVAPASITAPREHAIYRDALSLNRKSQRAHNVADLLERGHRSRPSANPAILVDILA
jgi:hypothetical protein